eukprot:jgi/Galph1/3421/GphlegSOOS_G2084.1
MNEEKYLENSSINEKHKEPLMKINNTWGWIQGNESTSLEFESYVVVPNRVHFIFGLREDFDGKPYSLIQFLSVLSAKLRLKPKEIILHYAFEPSGIWWNETKKLVTLRKVKVPTHVCGRPMYSAAHRADYLRLDILQQFGGIYLDMDTIVLQPFHFLRRYNFSIGEEGKDGSVGLGNAVLIANKNAKFLQRWRVEYCRSFDASHWNHHSVKLPYRLYTRFPLEAMVLPHDAFYIPLWDFLGLKELYISSNEIAHASIMLGDFGTFLMMGFVSLSGYPLHASDHIRSFQKNPKRSIPYTINGHLFSHHFVKRVKKTGTVTKCKLWEDPDYGELESSKVEIIRPYAKYYLDKQIYFYRGKYYRLNNIGLGELWYALLLDDNEPSDLTPERFKGLQILQKIKRFAQAVLSLLLGALAWVGWNILFASFSTFLVVVAAVSFALGVGFFVILWTIQTLENKFRS